MNKLLSATQLGEYLNLLPVTLRRKAKRREIPSIRVGNRIRFNKQQIDKWIKDNHDKKPMHILVVDDEPLVGQLFKDSLKEPDYQITATLSSLEALTLLNTHYYDLIFLDLLLPEIDGAELFRRIKQINEKIQVVIITGFPDNELLNRAMRYSPITLMKKPFTCDDIVSITLSLVDGTVT